MPHVFIGMSGGVDSSTAALLLQRGGYQISGVHLRLFPESDARQFARALADSEDARAVAQRLGFPFHVLDFSAQFHDCVVREFIAEYEAGRTPNPCVTCNRTIKFGALLEQVLSMGGDYLATGHYARIEYDEASGRWLLKRGADPARDQSYFLYRLTQEQLSHTLFPLGGFSKETVRSLAEENGLVGARKRDSQDICFVPEGDYAAVIEKLTGKIYPDGEFLDETGAVLGRHKGFIRYTRGQRRGLGVSAAEPLYVLGKDAASNTVRLGPDSALWSRELTAERMNWIAIPTLEAPLRVTAKTRHSQREAAAVVEPLPNGRARVVFDEPQRAITPGQAVVLYNGETVVGGGTICE